MTTQRKGAWANTTGGEKNFVALERGVGGVGGTRCNIAYFRSAGKRNVEYRLRPKGEKEGGGNHCDLFSLRNVTFI